MADSDDDSGSADLSLKLRRGSSDSRDSFYMEFDQGIDSDIEAVEAAARTAAAGGVAGGGQVGSGDDDLPPPPPPPPPLTEEDEMLPPPPPMEATIPERPYPSGVHVVHEEEEEEEEDEEIDVEDRGMDVVMGGVGSCIAIELPDVPELEEEDEEIEGSRTTVIMGEDQEGNLVLSLALGVPREVIEDGRDREEDSMADAGEGEVDDSRGDYEVEGVLEVEESVDEATEDDQIVVDVVGVLKEDADWETEEEIVLPPVIVDVGNIPDNLVLDLRERVPSYSDDVLEVEADVKQEPEDFNVVVDGGDILVPEERFQRDADVEQGIESPPKDILRKESLVDEIQRVQSPLQRVQSPLQRVQSPFQRVQSPLKDVHSPLEDNGSPAKDDRSSLKDVQSPVRDIRSPVVGDVESPLKDTESPKNDVHSPLKDMQSPSKDLQSPVKEAMSPLKDIPSPPKDVPSLFNDVPSPVKDVSSPTKVVTSPVNDVSSPTKVVTSPVKDISSPTKVVTSPVKDISSPTKVVTSPVKDVSCPTKVVTSPLKDVSPPPKVITSPLRDIPSPQKEVRSPLKDVPSPPRDIHSPPKDVHSPLQETKSPQQEVRSPPKYIRGVTSPLRDMIGVQNTLEQMQGMLKEMQRSQSPTVGVQSPQEKAQKIRSPVLDVERGQVPPRDVQRVQSPPKEVPKVKIPFAEMQRPIEDVQKLRSEPKDVQKVYMPPKDVQKPKSPTEEEGVREKVREEEEVTPGPSGSAQSSQVARMPSPASSSSATTTTSSDSASTPRRQRPGWDGSLATTDNEVAVAAAAAVALTTAGSPGAPLLLPSPASPSAILVSPETLSPSRSTPTVDLNNLQTPGHQMASAPHHQQGQQHIPNGAGLQRQAPSSLGYASDTGLSRSRKNMSRSPLLRSERSYKTRSVPLPEHMELVEYECIAPTQTGLMLYHPQMAPVAVQHHPHHVHHHPLHHHHSPGQHHVMPAAIKAAPEPPSPTVPVQAAPVPLPQPTLLHHPLQPSLPIHPSPSRSPAVPTPPIPPITARIEPEPDNWKKLGTDALTAALSALYGKLLVVMGIAFPMAEVISTYIPPSFYEGFYLYLYIGSMGFLFYMYAMLLRDRAAYSVMSSFKRARGISVSSDSGGNQTDTEGSSTTERSGNGQHYQHQPPPRHYKKHHQDEPSQQSKRYRSEQGMQALAQPGGLSGSEVGTTTAAEKGKQKYRRPRRRRSHMSQRTYHYGSFYLRMGAVAFGIGSMIYSGLEFGQYFELERNTKCHNVLLALTPATRMAFIFIQMYFIFLNNEMKVYKHKLLARFGLMHMIGTNLCVWLNVLVQETKHEILTFFNPENNTLGLHSHSSRQHTLAVKFSSGVTASTASLSAVTGGATQALHNEHLPASHQVHHRVERGLKGPHHIYECRRTNIMGSLVQDASPFLFPCTIEYSLICAAILYVMWKNISRVEMTRCGSSRIGKGVDCHGVGPPGVPGGSMVSSRGKVHITPKRSPHHYSVDCARAHKGLFVGILVLVLTIISLILFFVLIGRPELVGLAVFEVNMCELTLYALSTLATLAGMIRVRELRYDGGRNLELDSILLIVSQTGMFTYSTFTVIGGHFTLERNTALVLATALASLVQTTVQTIFVLDASRRSCATASQIRRKPGREVVTFLLVANLAMWAVNTLEKSRAESHPVQLHFYGLWAWTIITHVSMPLAIFYRFHSTVCLCEIWKRAYKMKPVYM